MYDYHYNYILPTFPGAKLLFTDTDSFCYWIPTEEDLYKKIKNNLKDLNMLRPSKFSNKDHHPHLQRFFSQLMEKQLGVGKIEEFKHVIKVSLSVPSGQA